MPRTKITIAALCLLVMSQSGFALQILDDASMSEVSGQDGITITINTPDGVNARIIWTDHDGLQPIAGENYGIANPIKGSLVLGEGTPDKNFRISAGSTVINVDADAGTTTPLLNIAIKLPDDLTIDTGNIYVAGRNGSNQLVNQAKIMNNMTIKLGGLNMNLQLGSAPQGDLVKVTGVINDGIRISNIGILAADTLDPDVGIGMDEVVIKDTGASPNLTFNGLKVAVLPSGLKITPSDGKIVDVLASNLRFGNLINDDGIGDVAIVGLKLGGTSLTISGH
jgi:hypothetical protein